MSIGQFLWKISVGLYLIANGALGLFGEKGSSVLGKTSDFEYIFKSLNMSGDTLKAFILIASVIAFVAGILVILEMLNIQVPLLDTLILIIAIIWVVYVVIGIVGWIGDGFKPFWYTLQRLGVHVMVLSSLLIASKKFS